MILAGTGHRPPALGLEYGRASRELLYKFALKELKKIENVEKLISGMATGWDQAIAHAAYSLGIPYIAAVPFRGQESKWPVDAQRYFRHLIEHAEVHTIVCPDEYSNQKYFIRDKWMVDNADTIFALFSGSKGGTSLTVDYAIKQGKPIINVWGAWNDTRMAAL